MVEGIRIDGLRWDLAKDLLQELSADCCRWSDNCTNAYQADRVAVLREYTDYSWSLDPPPLRYFEHLGGNNEEQQWANYRINEDTKQRK
jgi:hypothetical protein